MMTLKDDRQAESGQRVFSIVKFWPILVPALLVFLVYLSSVQFDFVWDDTIYLRDMPLYRNPDLWLSALFKPFVLSPNYFRPLAVLTIVGELRLAGLNPALFHFNNLLLHALNTGLLALLALRLSSGKSPLLAAGAGLLYGLHPALVEAVAFVSGRFDLLMTTFLLLVLLVDLTVHHRVARPVLIGLAFLLAALSKEMAVALVVVLPLWHLARGQGHRLTVLWQQRWVYLSVGLAGLVYLVLRYISLGYLLLPTPERALTVGSPLQHLLLVGKSLAGYLLLIVWPWGRLAPIHYSELPIPMTDAAGWAGLVLITLLIASFVWLFRWAPATGYLALASLLALLPVINLLPLELGGGAFIAERFLVFPLTMLTLAVFKRVSGLVASQAENPEQPPINLIVYSAAGLWLLLSFATVQLTLPLWRDDLTLWTWASNRAPNSSTPPANLALEYVELGDYAKGLDFAWQATELDPQNAAAWNNAGLALINLRQPVKAQAAFEQALELQPGNALYWNNLAGALREQGELAEAERVLLDQALRLDYHLPAAHLSLGIVYLRADRPDLAAVALQEALRLLPPGEQPLAQALLEQTQEPQRWFNLGELMLFHDELENALWAFEQADILGASPAEVGVGLSSALIGLGEWENANQVLNLALEFAPDDPRLYNNLGLVAREWGDIDRARQFFERAVELAPDWSVPWENLELLPPENPDETVEP